MLGSIVQQQYKIEMLGSIFQQQYGLIYSITKNICFFHSFSRETIFSSGARLHKLETPKDKFF